MTDHYSRRIMDHLAHRRYQPRTVRQLASDLGIHIEDLEAFRTTVESLMENGQVVLNDENSLALPPPGSQMIGVFRRHERGFGFVIPDGPSEHGDLFIPPGQSLDAMTGDRVRARIQKDRRNSRKGKTDYVGRIVEILQHAQQHHVGTLIEKGGQFFVQCDGRAVHELVLIRDPHVRNAVPGDKVVLELIRDAATDQQPLEGVLIEKLGEAGQPDVETVAVMRAYSLAETFPEQVLADARAAASGFDEKATPADREDLSSRLTLTIDPPDAKDYDDAISLTRFDSPQSDGAVWELGVHIADVSYFVRPGTALDAEARERGNSTYLPRRVIPMLPELLSNGVCSLQEGVARYTKSCFLRYNAEAHVVGERFARGVIRSSRRLTYLEAQALMDGDLREARKHARTEPNYPREVTHLLQQLDELARLIRVRRLERGMIVLGLPEVQLIFDDSGRVIDAVPEDDAFTHTIIEMCMVEANEAAARLFDRMGVPMIRRIHPDPDAYGMTDLRTFARVAGYNIPAQPSRQELQQLLDAVRGKPAQRAVHLAVLKTLSKAEYSPKLIGHFALASEHYTHFTSPIRRYPDLIVHRGLDAWLDLNRKEPQGREDRKRLARDMAADERMLDEPSLETLGRHCSDTEVNSAAAEKALRYYLVLELLQGHLGDDFEGTVTGITTTGLFIQLDKYLIDGFVRTQDLPGVAGERWRINPNTGALVAQRSGRMINIGDRNVVRIARIDLPRRAMELVIMGSGKANPATPRGPRKQPRKSARTNPLGNPGKSLDKQTKQKKRQRRS